MSHTIIEQKEALNNSNRSIEACVRRVLLHGHLVQKLEQLNIGVAFPLPHFSIALVGTRNYSMV